MRWWLKIRKRWSLDRELREEIAFHRQMRARDKELLPNDVPSFGNETQIREEMRDMWTFVSFETAWRDVCHALRGFRRNTAFTVIAVLTLAIGIGANTAIFSVVNGVLIKPLLYPHSERLVGVWHTVPGLNAAGSLLNCSPSMYFTYREESQTFQDFGVGQTGGTSVTGLGDPEQVRTLWVTYGTLQALGVQPLLGRWFSQADDSPGGTDPEPVILNYGYWQRRFGGDNSVLGRTMTVDSRLRQIVGVMPPGFRFLNVDPELIATARLDRNRVFQGNFSFQGIARLKPGVTLAQATADMERLLTIWKNAWPAAPGATLLSKNWNIKPVLHPLKQDVVGDTGDMLWVLMGTIAVVLLIACANVANLLLVRTQGRQQELAVRAALGASRVRIASELLIESLLLSLIGGAAGVGLAYAGLRLLVAIGPANLPRLNEISIDLPTLGFTLAVSVLSGLLFGFMPVLKYAGPRAAAALRGGGRTSSQSRERHRASRVLVVVQVALAMVLLVGSGLMIRAFQALRSVEPGFTKPESLQIFRISLQPVPGQQPAQVARIENEIGDKLAAIPGVRSVAFSSMVALEGRTNWDPVFVQDKIFPPGQAPTRTFQYVSPGFFGTIGTKLIAGRDFTWTDLYDYRSVAVVSENMARELWGDPAAALGKQIHEPGPNPPWREIIGVVQDVRNNGIQVKAPSIVYWPALLKNFYGNPVYIMPTVAFTIRTDRAGTESLLTEARQAVWSVNPNLPVFLVSTMRELYDRSLAATSFALVMLAIAGAMALSLALIGIYGVISYAVSQRTREIGIRLALGANSGELKRLFARNGLQLAGIGVVIGLGAAGVLTHLMKSLLFGISPLDPLSYGAMSALLIAAAVLASYLPARRAARVDPNEALRME